MVRFDTFFSSRGKNFNKEAGMRSVGGCLILLVIVFLQGCTTRMWYEGFKQAQASECSKLQDKERQECLRDAGISYDQYQRERQEVLRKDRE
jgi:hypothetical protein